MKELEDKLNIIDKKVDLLLYKDDAHLLRTQKIESKVNKIVLGAWAAMVVVAAIAGPKFFDVLKHFI